MKTSICVTALLLAATASAQPIALPDGKGGIGFDDMLYAPALHKVLVPAGRTGRLDLIDPKTRAVEAIPGFSSALPSGEGHGAGTTSADAGGGVIFASDRNLGRVDIVDVTQKKIVGDAKLGGGPDYVRWVEPLGEVWVTEPSKKQIEYFKFSDGKLARLGAFDVAGGPESLVIDIKRGRAYTHTWKDETVVIDLKSHAAVTRWKNGCKESRGIALDGARGFLFVGCDEGKATALDVAHDGKLLGSAPTGKGVDIIAFSPARNHLYVPAGDDATLSILSVGAHGELAVIATHKAAPDSHCAAADELGHAYVCDPKNGRVLVFDDE